MPDEVNDDNEFDAIIGGGYAHNVKPEQARAVGAIRWLLLTALVFFTACALLIVLAFTFAAVRWAVVTIA